MNDTALMVDVNEAGRRLGCGRTTIYELIAAGEIETVKIGRLTRIPVDTLAAFVAAQRGKAIVLGHGVRSRPRAAA